MIPGTSLSSVASNGTGDVIDFGEVCTSTTLFSFCTGSPIAGNVHLEGSHDGENWVVLGGSGSFDGSGTPLSFTSEGPAICYARAALLNLAGGTSPTVTATIAAK